LFPAPAIDDILPVRFEGVFICNQHDHKNGWKQNKDGREKGNGVPGFRERKRIAK
jgi:hypothetical protein